MSPTPTIDEQLGAVAAAPEDQSLREAAAWALTRAGRHSQAMEVLAGGQLINLSAHDGPTLPCLCKRCLQPELVEAQAEEIPFLRRFVVARGRVLFYWAPASLANDPGLRQAVRERLERRMGGPA